MAVLHRWQKNDAITADRLQAMTDEIMRLSAIVANVGGPLGGFAGEPALPMKINNILGRDIELGECVGLGAQSITGNWAKRVVDAEEIDEESHTDAFAIAARKIPSGCIGDGYVAGFCLALVNITDESHGYARVVAGEKMLQSDTSGQVKIVDSEESTGETFATVKLGISAASSFARFRVQSLDASGDYLSCKSYNASTGEEGESTVYVALPYALRKTPFDGETISYPYAGDVSYEYTGVQCRAATAGLITEYQYISQPYYAGDIIIATTGLAMEDYLVVGEAPIIWEDINVAARAWAAADDFSAY